MIPPPTLRRTCGNDCWFRYRILLSSFVPFRVCGKSSRLGVRACVRKLGLESPNCLTEGQQRTKSRRRVEVASLTRRRQARTGNVRRAWRVEDERSSKLDNTVASPRHL